MSMSGRLAYVTLQRYRRSIMEKELTGMGIQVFAVDQSPKCEAMNPSSGISGDSHQANKWLLDPLHAKAKAAGATIIDDIDN
ncbi:hypothetical protein SDRG_11592 [Saprolegnia diclina VS20]|uniref:Uncharacterized protein n=1 Tax=Saprolegnia diclina (strain VS20) TaxID=1156394 RepID=T0RLH6_SAPDV|nr:hypothetical protein SDRG_11592 [Saprolegnia diclina VS20]EQC30832.1 hypothetical protein SDRG_11592 [Saprolegnia diclina VS20]|eukprot:XP_008615856.1 hypothetical protein SDRG_11592 [Saprolegnia diclina VS20]